VKEIKYKYLHHIPKAQFLKPSIVNYPVMRKICKRFLIVLILFITLDSCMVRSGFTKRKYMKGDYYAREGRIHRTKSTAVDLSLARHPSRLSEDKSREIVVTPRKDTGAMLPLCSGPPLIVATVSNKDFAAGAFSKSRFQNIKPLPSDTLKK
jgi:hypothetical protein